MLQETDDDDDVQHQYSSTNDEFGDLVSEYDGLDTAYHQYDAAGTTDTLWNDDESVSDLHENEMGLRTRFINDGYSIDEAMQATLAKSMSSSQANEASLPDATAAPNDQR